MEDVDHRLLLPRQAKGHSGLPLGRGYPLARRPRTPEVADPLRHWPPKYVSSRERDFQA
jgi:hypothetical protein